MNKKVILILVIVLVLSFLGFLLFSKFYFRSEASEITTNSNLNINTASSESPQYSKVNTYNVPILMYHYIRIAEEGDEMGRNLSVTPKNFDDQLKWLKENNYQTIKISDLVDPGKTVISKIIGQGKLPIVLTFDDGYADAYTNALPILKKYNFIGVFYIIRNDVGKPEYMDEIQVNKMVDAGMEIGSHTLSHPNLASLDANAIQEQLIDSKNGASAFCYPAGKYNDEVVRLVKEAGYTTAVTTESGIANQDTNLFQLPRIRMQDFSGVTLGKKLNGN